MTTNEDPTPQARKKSSGSRAPVNPKTKVQKLLRLGDLTKSIEHHLSAAEAKGRERDEVVASLRDETSPMSERATFKEMAEATGISEQAFHKAFNKWKARQSTPVDEAG